MNISEFQKINQERAKKWHKGNTSNWSLLEWCGAMAGEVGEAANIAKKIKRLEQGLPNKEMGINKTNNGLLELNLSKEIADSIIYGIIILSELNVDVSQILTSVFNQKSIKYGFPERAPK